MCEICRRQRTPLLIATFIGGAALFISFKYRTVMQQSEAAKKANSKEGVNYSVAPGRSGIYSIPYSLGRLDPRTTANEVACGIGGGV